VYRDTGWESLECHDGSLSTPVFPAERSVVVTVVNGHPAVRQPDDTDLLPTRWQFGVRRERGNQCVVLTPGEDPVHRIGAECCRNVDQFLIGMQPGTVNIEADPRGSRHMAEVGQ